MLTLQKVDIHFTSPGKEGTVYINYMTFGLSDVPGKFQCATFRMSACFALMPDWYIEDKQKTRKGFFKSSSKSEQKIVYVERGITEDDLKNLLLICMPNIKSEVVFPALM